MTIFPLWRSRGRARADYLLRDDNQDHKDDERNDRHEARQRVLRERAAAAAEDARARVRRRDAHERPERPSREHQQDGKTDPDVLVPREGTGENDGLVAEYHLRDRVHVVGLQLDQHLLPAVTTDREAALASLDR